MPSKLKQGCTKAVSYSWLEHQGSVSDLWTEGVLATKTVKWGMGIANNLLEG